MKKKVTDPLVASLLSSATMSGLALLSIKVWNADPQSTSVMAIFGAVIMACILMAEGENDERLR